MTYKVIHDGEWIAPVRNGYRLACCDCGLIHIVNFRTVKYGNGVTVQFQLFRDNRKTAAMRRHRKKKRQ